jgi:hypothetical protein
MIVAMVAMWMVEMALYQVIHMIAMRNCIMTAIGTMLMALFVRSALVCRRALCRITSADGDLVLVHAIGFDVMQVSIVKVIHMIVVLHGFVPAIGTVYMRMHRMNLLLSSHPESPSCELTSVLPYTPHWRLLSI